ncbi:MAG: glutathione S-transferase family protein [Comamonadaceae bacterium]|nr:MAG: glutathione S-transferase family protein [Comamonadaceae bacterium]
MALTLHFHPLSSHCHKVLIALYELGTPFQPRVLDLGDAQQRAAFLALWPTGKMPLLQDGDRVVPETTVIVEYLTQHHAPAGQTLLPADAQEALEVRLMDRLVDLYVMHPMQAIVADRLRAEAGRDPIAVAKARETLAMAYGLLEQRLADPQAGERAWIAGPQFSLADCTAAPSLFYATTLVALGPRHPRLAAYFERLLARPAVARVIDEARPFFQYYPYREALPARFYTPEAR